MNCTDCQHPIENHPTCCICETYSPELEHCLDTPCQADGLHRHADGGTYYTPEGPGTILPNRQTVIDAVTRATETQAIRILTMQKARAERERDEAQAALRRVAELCDRWEATEGSGGSLTGPGAATRVRAALAGQGRSS